MHYGIEIVTLGEYADPRKVIALAHAAEAAGWEGLFVWDHLGFTEGMPSGDPWVTLAAAAMVTSSLRLCASVTPVPRRRPQVLAQTIASLDLLSGGRVIFAAGLGGVPEEYSAYGEPPDARQRAEMLDEALPLLAQWWSGETVDHQGPHYRARGVTLAPLPVQKPRPPIWIGGDSPPALRRAARWDGWATGATDPDGSLVKTPPEIARSIAYIHQHRTTGLPFEVSMTGCSTPETLPELAGAYGAAGVTWWLESLHGLRGSFDFLLERIQAGPPAP